MLLKLSIPFFFVVSLSLCSFAKEKTEHSLLAVASENYLLQYQENGENKGPTVEILNGFLQEAQLKASVSFMPWARALATAKNNPNTLILSIIRTPEREDHFHWLIKVSQLARVFISLESKPENYVDNIDQAKKKLIAVVLGSAAHNELLSYGFSEQTNLYLVSNGAQIANLFANGRVDLVYDDPNNLLSNLNIKGKANTAISYKKITIENQRISYIALNKDTDASIVNKLQHAARKFEKTAKYPRLLAK